MSTVCRYAIIPYKLNSSDHGHQHGVSTEQPPTNLRIKIRTAREERATSQARVGHEKTRVASRGAAKSNRRGKREGCEDMRSFA